MTVETLLSFLPRSKGEESIQIMIKDILRRILKKKKKINNKYYEEI
jgi:hypothetical protein